MTAQGVKTRRHEQRGSALILSLIFLLLMTIIGITAVSMNSLEERMANNQKDVDVAFQSAESADRQAETWLGTQSTPPLVLAPGALGSNDAPVQVWATGTPPNFTDSTITTSWWSANAEEYGSLGTQNVAQALADPRFVVQYKDFVRDNNNIGQGPPTGRTYYSVTGHGVGTNSGEATVQSTYVVRFN